MLMARVHIAAAAALALAAGGAASTALGQAAPFAGSGGPFFDYGLPDTGKPGQPGFAPAPFLDNNAASAATVSTLLAQRQSQGLLLAVKVREPLTNPAAVA